MDFDTDEITREIRIMKNLKHQNIVEYIDYLNFDVFSDILIMELCEVKKELF